MFTADVARPAMYERFTHPVPQWFRDCGLGIFIHWGSYSVPAWAEPIGEAGTNPDPFYWQKHNPYAEWYWNTMRIDGSPTMAHHRATYGDMPYEGFLDMWHAEAFDPDDMADLFARAGARYVVPTTKHHEGITLWDAPGSGGWNTVDRGPRRNLVDAFAESARGHGLRFGVYYSTGLDWHKEPHDPLTGAPDDHDRTAQGEGYARYMYAQVMDLIDRYRPDVLWGDIDVPAISEQNNDFGVARIFDRFYEVNPEGVVNDRWGLTHWDFRTVEYAQGAGLDDGCDMWQQARGIGYSFGYNQLETSDSYMTGAQAVRLLADTVSRGGNLLLNVGPRADGSIPDMQRRCLEDMAAWMEGHAPCVHDVRPFPQGMPSDDPWIRWTCDDRHVYALVDDCGETGFDLRVDGDGAPGEPGAFDPHSATMLGDGTPVRVTERDGGIIHVDIAAAIPPIESGTSTDSPHTVPGPSVIRFDRRT